ncbi:MAG: inosine-5-monophosphate dehydrogenase [Hyphomicrobiales bacterium]|nr:MAG: inosine-5-monophosphate dehydrogenase [Hyphomicrobiales bacterium]
MTVSAILAEKGTSVFTANKSSSITQIIHLLAKNKIGSIVITDETGSVCGIVSERDIVRDIAIAGTDALDADVSNCMTAEVISCTRHDTISHVMAVMTEHRFRHMPVVEDGKLLGLVSIGDVVKRKIEDTEREAEEMRSYIAS